jgi:heme A synthase
VKQTYRILAGLVALGVLVQAAAVAFGWFDVLNDVENGLVLDQNTERNAGHLIHGIVGLGVIPLLGLILLIVSFFAARVVPGARAWAGIVFGLIVLQVALAIFGFSLPVIGALHGLNALILLGAAGRAAMLARDDRGAGSVGVPRQRSDSGTTSASGKSLSV